MRLPTRWIAALAALGAAALALAQAPDADGEVTKIDKAAGKLTIRHGEIKSLDMPPMTMVFRVADPKMLDAVTVGDKIRFAADKRGGAYTVTTLQRQAGAPK